MLIKRRNLILYKVENDNGCVQYEAKAVKEIFCRFYKNLFQISEPDASIESLLVIEPRITVDMNHDLDKPYTTEEITSALFQMSPLVQMVMLQLSIKIIGILSVLRYVLVY